MAELEKSLEQAFTAAGVDPSLAVIVRCERPDLADFQTNGAFLAAKATKQNPRVLADKIVELIEAGDNHFSVAGPGFINMKLGNNVVEQIVNGEIPSPTALPQYNGRIVLDFGGPNVAKPMHVGHLRSLVIGDALQRIFRYVGYEVISDVHFGDWGLQMGLLLVALEGTPLHEITIDVLEETYPQAAARAKTDEPFKLKAQTYTRMLQEGDPELRKRWKKFYDLSMETVERELLDLNINFTCYKGESDAQATIPSMIDGIIEAGNAYESDGALVMSVLNESVLLLRKSDGAALYATTDLATILDRKNQLGPDKIIYVTDQRQSLHFAQVFDAATKMEYVEPGTLEHIGFGTVNDTNGQPLKTRAGGVPKLHDLIQEATALAAERNVESARAVALAALKFADLQNPRLSSYVFDLAKFLSFEGKTGPYVLYQAVRIKSVLAKAVEPGRIEITTPMERDIALRLKVLFPLAVEAAVRLRSPKELIDHVYELAQAFSKFYGNHEIANNPSRVALVKKVLEQIETCLYLLGISVPEKM